jgi:hypothetical protein
MPDAPTSVDAPDDEPEQMELIDEEIGEESVEAPGVYGRAPDGSLRWPAPDRDSPQFGDLTGSYRPDAKIGAFLKMEGQSGRSENDIARIAGLGIKRPRRWHKLFERMGLLYPGEGITRLARLGRMLRDAAEPEGFERLMVREILAVLRRYQFDNPFEKSLPDGCDVHPYYAVLRAASLLDWRIHWDEVNRELMRMMRDDGLADVVEAIRNARAAAGYEDFIGKTSNAPGLLRERTHPAKETAPPRKTPEGQLRDQEMTPFLKKVGFGELLLVSPGHRGGGFWTVPPEIRDVVTAAVATPPEGKRFATTQEWIEWFCEGTTATMATSPPPLPPSVKTPVDELTLETLKSALAEYEPDLVFSTHLLASVVAALRAGDGRNFMILRGVSGTGKSRLVAALAKAVYGDSKLDLPYLTIIEVRPDWIDGSPLLGHYDPIGCRYIRERFLDALLVAEANPASPVFVCLDEMNLARVEYYLADCLSAMESGNRLNLDRRDDPLVPSSVIWPPNLYLFGTVNIDETTLNISDKVLDRAQVIDTSDIELLPQLGKWLASAIALNDAERARVQEIIGGSWKALKTVHAHFGFRTGKASVRFVNEAKASSNGVMSVDDAIDAQMRQKILVKLRGEGEHWAAPLAELETLLGRLSGTGHAIALVSRMRQDLERLGSFQFWS